MLGHPWIHRLLRAILSLHPRKPGAAWLNRRLDRFFGGRGPTLLLAPARGQWPTMVLDVSSNLQRKFYYFPRAYGRFYGNNTFRRYLDATLPPGGRFVEIGASVGFFTLHAARLVGPGGRVYAFEPEPATFAALVRSAATNGYTQVDAFQLALSNRDGELTFHRATDGTANSLVPEAKGREHRYEATLTARVTSLDRLVASGTLDPCGLTAIKVDVEGEEANTIAGMRETLVHAGRPPLWVEVRGPKASTRAPNTFVAVRDLLAPLGYRAFEWRDGTTRPVDEGDVVTRMDVLFERA